MTNIVSLHDPRTHARTVKARLWNPKNGRASSDLDVISGAELRRRQELELEQREEAKRAEADFRRETALDDLMRRALAEHTQVKDIARKVLIEEESSPPKIEVIIDAVVAAFKVPRIDIISHRRTFDVTRPRMVVMYLARKLTFKSMPEIGRAIGKRDHTTVLSAVRRVEQWMAENVEFRSKVDGLLESLSWKP